MHTDDAQPAPVRSTDPRTGAYSYGTDPFVHAIDFLAALKKDGLIFPASSSLDARTARARWSTGVAGLFFDGPWNIGVIKDQFKAFIDSESRKWGAIIQRVGITVD